MKIRALAIQLPAVASDPAASFDARVQLDINGEIAWFDFAVSPLGMPGSDARLIEAEPAFVERFRQQRKAARQVRRLVGQAVQRGGVHLPQLIAA